MGEMRRIQTFLPSPRFDVEIGLESGLAKLEGVLAARERYCDRATVQIVAFPQSGVMRCPSPYGTGDLLERAAMIGWKGDFRRDDQVEVAFDLVSNAGARALCCASRILDPGRPSDVLSSRSEANRSCQRF
jgi:hypothetical protein